jgi:hypothetical protein
MGEFVATNIVSIIFGLTSLITTSIALHYRRLEYLQRTERIVAEGKRVGLFLSRAAMIKYLLSMYDKAEKGDVIWAQCVRCTDFGPAVRTKTLKAAGQGVRFLMIINKYSPSLEEFRALFDPIHNAELVEGADNTISVQGLSDREVVLAFPGVDAYTAVLIRDQYFTKIVRAWFDKRFRQIEHSSSQTT